MKIHRTHILSFTGISFSFVRVFIFALTIALQHSTGTMAAKQDSALNNQIRIYLTNIGINSHDSILTANLKKIVALTELSDPYTCSKYLVKLAEIYQHNGNRAMLAEAYNSLGNSYMNQNLYYLALDNYFKCYKIYEELNQVSSSGYSLCNMGNIYFAQKAYPTAQKLYKQGLLAFIQCKDTLGQAVIYNNLGLIMNAAGKTDSTLYFFNKAYLLRKQTGIAFYIAHSENYMGKIWTEKGQVLKGFRYLQQALKTLGTAAENPTQTAYLDAEIRMTLALNYQKQRKFNLALECLEKCNLTFEKSDDASAQSIIYHKISKIHQECGNYNEAEKALRRSLDFAFKSRLPEQIREVYSSLSDILAIKGDINGAYDFVKKTAEISDSLLNSFNLNKFQEISLAVQTNESFKQNVYLKKLTEKNQLLLLISTFSFLIIIAFLLLLLRNNKKNNNRFKELSNSTFEGIIIHSNGIIAEMNTQVAQLLNNQRDQLIGTDIYKYIDKNYLQDIRKIAGSNTYSEYTTTLHLPDGTVKNVEILSKPINYRGKNMRVAAIRDITKMARILEENQVLWTAIRQSPNVILITDRTGIITYTNPCFSITTGYTAEEVKGRSPGILKSGFQTNDYYKSMWETLHNQKIWKGEFYNKKKDGSFFWENAIISPVTDNNGITTHFLAIKEDITEKKKSERNLRRKDLMYRSLASQLPNTGIILFDNNLHIVLADGPIIKILGLKSDKIENQHAYIVFPAERQEGLKEMMTKCFAGETFELSAAWNNTDFEIIIKPVADEPDSIFLGMMVIRDITEVLKKETILLRSEIKLKELNDTKDKFFSIIAHDLRNPFNIIMGFADLLSSNFEELDDTSKLLYIKNIQDGAENTYKLLVNLLEWARSQTDSLEFNPDTINLHLLVSSTIQVNKQQAQLKEIKIINELDPVLEVYADLNMVKTIVRNLVSNAIKYTLPGGKVTIYAKLIQKTGMVEVSVEDTGIGMTSENLQKLFKVGEKIKTPGTANEQGTGLGLILCSEFVQKNGGSIRAESTPAKGSRIFFTLPVGPASG